RDEVVGGAGKPGAEPHEMLDLWHPGGLPAAAPGDRGDLIRGQAGHEAPRREHLDVLLVERDEPAHRLLARLADIAVDADHQVLAELPLLAGARRGVLIGPSWTAPHLPRAAPQP